MRTVVLLLVIANLALWGASRLGVGGSPSGEPERLAQQIGPERLKIVARGEPPPASAMPATTTAPAEKAAVELACISYADLADEAADALVPIVTRRAPELMVARDRDQIHVNGHRVQIDQLGSRALAERKARELRDLGVNDYTIVGSGGVWVVSLGVYSDDAAARARLSALRKRGVRSAGVQAITYPDSRARVTVSGAADSVARAGEAVRQSQPDLTPEACVASPADDGKDPSADDSRPADGGKPA